MTRKQLQSEIVKQFKRRLRVTYGRWQDLWELHITLNATDDVDLMKLSFISEFTTITIIFDNFLNASISVSGTELVCCLRPFMDVAEDIDHYIHWLLSKDKLYQIVYGGR